MFFCKLLRKWYIDKELFKEDYEDHWKTCEVS